MSSRDIELALARVEAKLDLIMASILQTRASSTVPSVDPTTVPKAKSASNAPERFFRRFSIKQNAALQMLIHAASNDEIAERMGVSPNTAKVHVRTIAKKLGVNTRAQIMAVAGEHYRAIDDESYRAVTGGIPKDWHQNFRAPDPFAHIYRGDQEDES